jgi:hypothetical protein
MRREESLYYLRPPGFRAERNHVVLVLRRPDSSVINMFGGQHKVGEIVERYAWEDTTKRKGRLERTYEQISGLPVSIVLCGQPVLRMH